jgi:hypothetical protein
MISSKRSRHATPSGNIARSGAEIVAFGGNAKSRACLRRESSAPWCAICSWMVMGAILRGRTFSTETPVKNPWGHPRSAHTSPAAACRSIAEAPETWGLSAASYNLGMVETEIIFSVQESPEGGYEARALDYSIFTQADTMDELKRNVREAVHCHFDDGEAPRVVRLHEIYSG